MLRHGSAAAVARELDVSDAAVRRARDSFGLPKRGRGRPRCHTDKLGDAAWLERHALRSELPRMHPKHLRPYSDVATSMKSAGVSVSLSTVYRALQRAGVRDRDDSYPGPRASKPLN